MVNIILGSLVKVGTKLLLSLGSEAVIKQTFFYIAESVVKSTKTEADDKLLQAVKDNYDKK